MGVSYLYKLKDVAVGSQTDGQALVWSAAVNRWIPGAGGGGGGSTNLVENSFTTNALAPALTWDPSVRMMTIASAPGIVGVYQITSNGITVVSISSDNNSVLPSLAISSLSPNTVIKSDSGGDLVSIPNAANGFLLGISNSVPTYITNISELTVTNLTVITNNVSVLNVSQTIKVNGKAATVFSVNGTEYPIANLTNSSTVTWGGSGTNITAAVKLRSYLVLIAPHSCDGAGAIIYTNDNTKAYFGQAAFSGSAATNANYVEYRLTVPEDLDTSVDLKVERWKVRLGAADTSAQTYNIGMASVADSAAYDSPTIGQWIALSLSADASGASGDVETVSNVTLTGWRSNMTAGQLLVIRVNRDGAGDSSTQTSYSGPLVISYQVLQ